MTTTLTKRQKEILDFIKVSTQINGYAPSLGDIKKQFQLSAISTVHEHIKNLKQKGYITTQINQPRSIEVIDNTVLEESKFVDIPIMGNLKKNMTLGESMLSPIKFHSSQLAAHGQYFGYQLKFIIKQLALNIDDILVFKEIKNNAWENKLLLIKNHNSYYIGSADKSQYKVYLSGQNTKLIKNGELKGELITLIRNYGRL